MSNAEKDGRYKAGMIYLGQLDGVTITSEEEAERLAFSRKEVANVIKNIEAERKEITGEMMRTKKKTDEFFKKLSAPYNQMKQIMDERLLEWGRAKRDKAAKALEAVAEASSTSEKKALLAKASDTAPTAGTIERTRYQIEIVDESKVPSKYLVVDQIAIKKDVRASKGTLEIPGVKIIEEKYIQG